MTTHDQVATLTPHCPPPTYSWSINVIDGLLLIVAHATASPLGEGFQTNSFYRHVYDSKYVYGVWLIEVSIAVG